MSIAMSSAMVSIVMRRDHKHNIHISCGALQHFHKTNLNTFKDVDKESRTSTDGAKGSKKDQKVDATLEFTETKSTPMIIIHNCIDLAATCKRTILRNEIVEAFAQRGAAVEARAGTCYNVIATHMRLAVYRDAGAEDEKLHISLGDALAWTR
eukprot:6252-Amphidinium_carterae.1